MNVKQRNVTSTGSAFPRGWRFRDFDICDQQDLDAPNHIAAGSHVSYYSDIFKDDRTMPSTVSREGPIG